MNFRECRIVSLHKLIDYSCGGGISVEDSFLMLGGIRNSIYYFHSHGVDMIGTSGTEEINCPGIFEELDIAYEPITVSRFEQETEEVDAESAPHFYLVSVMAEMLNKPFEEFKGIGTFGQSFFVVERVENKIIHFYYPFNSTWIDIDILREVEKNKEWLVETDVCIYKISKELLLENKVIHSLAKKSTEKYVLEVLKRFGIPSEIKGDEGTVRIDGPEVYDRVIDYFEKMKEYLEKCKDEKRRKSFCNYIYLQVIQFRKFMLSGTDGYYRSEFNDILHKLYRNNNAYTDILSKWDGLENTWRIVGRELSRNCTYNYSRTHPKECIDSIIDIWKEVRETEPALISETIGTIEKNRNINCRVLSDS